MGTGLIRRNDEVALYANEKVYLFFVYMDRIKRSKWIYGLEFVNLLLVLYSGQ